MPHNSSLPEEPTLAELLQDLWRAKWILMAGAVLGLACAFIFLAVSIPHYRAALLVAPAERAAARDTNVLLADNSSFAAQQHFVKTMGAAQSGDFMRFEHILRGPSVARKLLEDQRFMEGYRRTRRYRFQNDPSEASAEKLSEFLQKHIKIEPVGATPMRRLVFTHPDPSFAGYALRRLHEEADKLIRNEIRGTTQSRETYLQQALESVSHPDHRRALTSMLMEQQHVRMVLAMEEPFAAIIAEPPVVGSRPHWPKAPIVYGLFLFAGMFVFYAGYRLRQSIQS